MCTYGGRIWQNGAHGERTRRGRCLWSREDHWYASRRGTIKVSSMLRSNTAWQTWLAVTSLLFHDAWPTYNAIQICSASLTAWFLYLFSASLCFALCILFQLCVQLLLWHIVHLVSPSFIQLLCPLAPLLLGPRTDLIFLFVCFCRWFSLYSLNRTFVTTCTRRIARLIRLCT